MVKKSFFMASVCALMVGMITGCASTDVPSQKLDIEVSETVEEEAVTPRNTVKEKKTETATTQTPRTSEQNRTTDKTQSGTAKTESTKTEPPKTITTKTETTKTTTTKSGSTPNDSSVLAACDTATINALFLALFSSQQFFIREGPAATMITGIFLTGIAS